MRRLGIEFHIRIKESATQTHSLTPNDWFVFRAESSKRFSRQSTLTNGILGVSAEEGCLTLVVELAEILDI